MNTNHYMAWSEFSEKYYWGGVGPNPNVWMLDQDAIDIITKNAGFTLVAEINDKIDNDYAIQYRPINIGNRMWFSNKEDYDLIRLIYL